jgi:4-amino-4-deoxy-L-arabinose transferase-like glycosyltransferase
MITGGILLYLVACAVAYLDYPLALSPQLDAAENLRMAADFDTGNTYGEPFYRAPLYPYLLSLVHPVDLRPLFGMLFGFLCHLLNGALVYGIATRIWKAGPPALLAAGFYLLNPASIFFSFQVLDITAGTCLFLAGVFLLFRNPGDWRTALGAGFLFGLAVATRPHFLPVVVLAPAVFLLLKGGKRFHTTAAYGGIAAVLLVIGLINVQRSGEFRMLPWQGAYNLWAANKPGANGLYFKQEIDLSGLGEISNPAREESRLLYGQAHPDEALPYAIDTMNAHWRSRFIGHVFENPLQVARLWAFKAYAVLNSWEQYNNVTFAFHKARLPLLRFNPLNWGLLLLAATLGALALGREHRHGLLVMLLLVAGYASALVLYYASARFRLPMVPLLAVMAGGVIFQARNVISRRKGIATSLLLLIPAGFLAFSSFASVRDTDTFVQDRLLLANACAETERDSEAAELSLAVLEEHPERREAQRIYTVSYFNLRLIQSPGAAAFGSWEDQMRIVIQQPRTDPVQDVILGAYFWQWGDPGRAAGIWKDIAPLGGPAGILARACLAATGIQADPAPEIQPLRAALEALFSEKPETPEK